MCLNFKERLLCDGLVTFPSGLSFWIFLIHSSGILGAFSLAVKAGFQENLHAVFCLAENAVGPKAQRPDDVVTMYSGRLDERVV